MIYVISIFGGLFIALCMAMLYVFYRERHFGIFLMGVTYGTSGLLAIALPHWWPIVVGFVMVWMLKLMGLEQGAGPQEHDPDENTEPPSQVKDRN